MVAPHSARDRSIPSWRSTCRMFKPKELKRHTKALRFPGVQPMLSRIKPEAAAVHLFNASQVPPAPEQRRRPEVTAAEASGAWELGSHPAFFGMLSPKNSGFFCMWLPGFDVVKTAVFFDHHDIISPEENGRFAKFSLAFWRISGALRTTLPDVKKAGSAGS